MLFRAKTDYGYMFKILTELIKMNVKNAYFTIDKNGIYMSAIDSNMWLLFDLELDHKRFLLYIFDYDEQIKIGLNLKYFYQMIRSMKKRDTIELFIENDKSDKFGIRVYPRENNRISESFLKIYEYQLIEIDIPGKIDDEITYGRPINICANDFQKMIKDLCGIANTIRIESTQYIVKFSSIIEEVLSKEITFGDIQEHSNYDQHEIIYKAEFNVQQILTIIKVASLSVQLQLYCVQDLPLLLKTNVGPLGDLSIYIKSKDMLNDVEQLTVENKQ